MSDLAINMTSTIKRGRPSGSTKAAVEHRRQALVDIVVATRPMTVRQAFYQATVNDIVEKTEAGYRSATEMLRRAALPMRLPLTCGATLSARAAAEGAAISHRGFCVRPG